MTIETLPKPDSCDTETDMTDSTILGRIAQGDKAAVDACLDKYSGLVWSLARRACASLSDAEDAVQDIFVELWQKADRFDPSKASEVTFVATLARRRLIDRYRRDRRAVEAVNIESNNVDVAEPELIDAAELADEAAKAARCLSKLPEEQKRVVTMSIHAGHSHSKIAEMLSMPIGTVKSYARRSLLQLRKCMSRSATGGANA
ncbi:MAG: sigma-70 family RNA polymerase sigma factor [Aureliella sp.]